MSAEHSGVPDLLHRFVEAPYAFTCGEHPNILRVETNDLALAGELQMQSAAILPVSQGGGVWKLLRDNDSPIGGTDHVILRTKFLITILQGAGTVLWIDHERHEILGFVACDVQAKAVIGLLISTLRELNNNATTPATNPPATSRK